MFFFDEFEIIDICTYSVTQRLGRDLSRQSLDFNNFRCILLMAGIASLQRIETHLKNVSSFCRRWCEKIKYQLESKKNNGYQ